MQKRTHKHKIYVCANVYAGVYMHNIYLYIEYGFTCVSEHEPVCMYMYMYTRLYACVRSYVCAHLYLRVCTCVYVVFFYVLACVIEYVHGNECDYMRNCVYSRKC